MINEEIEALRRLPYSEYLKTEHWQRQRKGALQRSAYSCQVCKQSQVQLDVHHNTYERIGCELPSDLFVLCHDCHELFSKNGRLAAPDLDEYEEEEWEAQTALVETQPGEGRLQSIANHIVNHPRLDLTGGTLLLAFGVDIFVRFDPFGVIIGLTAAAVVYWKGDDLVQSVAKWLIPGSNQDAVRESAEDFADQFLDGYPVYADQSFGAKMHRFFHPFEEGEIVDPPKRKKVKSLPVNTGNEPLTCERICTWFEHGIIDDVQFFALLNHIDNPQSGNDSGNDATVEHEAASEAVGTPQMEPLRPVGWDERKEQQLIGAYLALGAQSKAIEAIGLSDGQRNRDYAREVLKRNGFLKGK